MASGELTTPSPDELSSFAQEVMAAVASGTPFGARELPAEHERERTIPASLIRDLALGTLAARRIEVHGVVLEGDLDLSCQEWRGALDLAHCRIRGRFDVAHTAIHGRVCLDDAVVEGEIYAPYLQLDGPLYCRRTVVRGGIFALNARISGSLNLTASEIWAPEDRPNRCAVELFRAELGDLFLARSALHGGLYANGMTVERNVRLQSAFVESRDAMGWKTDVDSVDGGVSLVAATIGAALYLSWADTPESVPAKPPIELRGRLNLTRVTCITLRVRASELAGLAVQLDHLRYSRLVGIAPAEWLAKLEATRPTHTQPYVHLAQHCVEQGRTDEQRRVLIALQRRITSELPETSWERLRRRLWAATVTYGYRPGLAILWLLALTFLCVLVVCVGGDFLVYAAEPPAQPTRGVGSVMTAIPIAMDNMLPFAGLSVAKQWSVDPASFAQTLWLMLFVLLKLVGWGMAALGLASVTGIVKKP